MPWLVMCLCYMSRLCLKFYTPLILHHPLHVLGVPASALICYVCILSDGWTPVHDAAAAGHTDIINLFAEQ